jgi:hypothetical protein
MIIAAKRVLASVLSQSQKLSVRVAAARKIEALWRTYVRTSSPNSLIDALQEKGEPNGSEL